MAAQWPFLYRKPHKPASQFMLSVGYPSNPSYIEEPREEYDGFCEKDVLCLFRYKSGVSSLGHLIMYVNLELKTFDRG